MVVYPLSAVEHRMLSWAAGLVPAVAAAVTLLLVAMSAASAGV